MQGEPRPGTADYLAFHAHSRPDHPAVVDLGAVISYRRFYEDLHRVIGVIMALGVPTSSFVAVEWNGLYRHWLLLQALECLGVPSFSYSAGAYSPVYEAVIRKASWVMHLTDRAAQDQRQTRIDDAWWDAVFASVPVDRLPPPPMPQTLQRIVCSSGTTAAAKVMAQTALQAEARQRNCLWYYGLSNRTRHLVTLGFMLQADYLRAIATLRSGGTVIYDNRQALWQTLLDYQPTHIGLMPVHLSPILDKIGTGPQPEPFHITAYGGRVPPVVRQRLLSTIATGVVEQYGTNEFGVVATIDEDGIGAVYPGVSLEIVDEADRIQPYGTVGRIRVRNAGCVDGYLFTDAEITRNFRDGWCYPGDIGMLEGPFRLHLQGREDDILNIRGIKLYAPEYEALLGNIAGIRDIAVLEHPEKDGIPSLHLILVRDPVVPMAAIRQAIAKILTNIFGRYYLVPVEKIPRTETGKIQRKKLGAALHDLLAKENNHAG